MALMAGFRPNSEIIENFRKVENFHDQSLSELGLNPLSICNQVYHSDLGPPIDISVMTLPVLVPIK